MNALIQGRRRATPSCGCGPAGAKASCRCCRCTTALDCSVSSREQAERVARLGCEAVQLEVPMRVDLKFGRNWGDAKHTWEELHGALSRP